MTERKSQGKLHRKLQGKAMSHAIFFCKDESFLNEEIDSFSIFYWFDFQFWIEIFEVSKYEFHK